MDIPRHTPLMRVRSAQLEAVSHKKNCIGMSEFFAANPSRSLPKGSYFDGSPLKQFATQAGGCSRV